MIKLPQATFYGKVIPKARFYENLNLSSVFKKAFSKEINQIIWQSKIAPTTINLPAGESVEEIQVFLVKLNQKALNEKVLSQIDREIPYHILFILEFEAEQQAWIAYKEAKLNDQSKFKAGVYYHSEWLPTGSQLIQLRGLNLDTVYENLIRQIAGERLEFVSDAEEPLPVKDAIELDAQRNKIQKQIERLTRSLQTEKQFNRQVEINNEIKRLQKDLEALVIV